MSQAAIRPLCKAPLQAQGTCFRAAAVLATDVYANDPTGYVPVCKVHMREAITRGLCRSAQRPAGYRQPVMILPLETTTTGESPCH